MDHRVRPPQVIGHEMAETVAEVGAGVMGLRPGDKVVVRRLDYRGQTVADKGISHICRNLKFLGIDTPGAFQGSWTGPAFTIHRLPPDIDLKLAALTEPRAVACHDVRHGRVAAGETVVVIGARHTPWQLPGKQETPVTHARPRHPKLNTPKSEPP